MVEKVSEQTKHITREFGTLPHTLLNKIAEGVQARLQQRVSGLEVAYHGKTSDQYKISAKIEGVVVTGNSDEVHDKVRGVMNDLRNPADIASML